MVSLQSLLSKQRHSDSDVPLVPGPATGCAQSGEPMLDQDGPCVSMTDSPQRIDISAEETCPAPTLQVPALQESTVQAPAMQMPAEGQDGASQRDSDTQAPQVPSATTFELMNKLEALASDLGSDLASDKASDKASDLGSGPAVSERDASDQRVANDHEGSGLSVGSQTMEPSICVTPRPSAFGSDPFASDRRSIGQQAGLTLVGLLTAALIGVGGTFAWQSYHVRTMTPSNAADQQRSALAVQVSAPGAAPSQPGPVAQATPPAAAPEAAPELAKQLESMVQDLTLVRRGVEQLAAKQEQLAAAQQQLEQLVAKQQQLAARQDQMAQSIAKLQTREQNIRQRITAPPASRAVLPPPPSLSRVVPPPSRTPPEPATQLSSAPAPRPEPHPLPPLPIPP
jgi:hypothetical protein